MALEAVSTAQDDEEREGLRKIYRRARAKLEALEAQFNDAQALQGNAPSEELVNAAIAELKDLRTKLADTSDRRELSALFHAMNLRVYVKFKKIRWNFRRGGVKLNRYIRHGRQIPGTPYSFLNGRLQPLALFEQ